MLTAPVGPIPGRTPIQCPDETSDETVQEIDRLKGDLKPVRMLPKKSMPLPQHRHQGASGKRNLQGHGKTSQPITGRRGRHKKAPSAFVSSFEKEREENKHQDKGGEKKAHEAKKDTHI